MVTLFFFICLFVFELEVHRIRLSIIVQKALSSFIYAWPFQILSYLLHIYYIMTPMDSLFKTRNKILAIFTSVGMLIFFPSPVYALLRNHTDPGSCHMHPIALSDIYVCLNNRQFSLT